MKKGSIRLHPLIARFIWVIYAVLFYQSGLTATEWLLEPEQFNGAIDWLWLILFPISLPMFLVVNRRLGCASGYCTLGGQNNDFRAPPG